MEAVFSVTIEIFLEATTEQMGNQLFKDIYSTGTKRWLPRDSHQGATLTQTQNKTRQNYYAIHWPVYA